MISTFTAFFDANVFYGARLRSLVLYIAQTKLFRARWSELVHDEWIRNLIAARPDLTPEKLQRSRDQMNAAVPDCLVTDFECLIPSIELPDMDDRHIVAAAIMTRAHTIVTFNLRDFPCEQIEKFRLHAKHPDEFLTDTFSLSPEVVAEAVLSDFLHYKTPKLTFESYCDSLRKAGVPNFAKIIEPLKVLVPTDYT